MTKSNAGDDDTRLGVAVVGAGYWGRHLVRNFSESREWRLVAVCDHDVERGRSVATSDLELDVTDDVAEVLAREDVDAVAVATPAGTHHALVMQALRAGKHVLVEKPLAADALSGAAMVQLAGELGLVLMADHTYCYTPAVLRIRELIAAGELGDLLYVDSVRINLGLVQPDVDVFWDLAPHDLSILDFVLPDGLRPLEVSAQGADPLGAGKSCVGYLSLALEGGAMAHVHVNWLSPTKIRKMVFGGTRRTLVWDDLNPQQRISVYDRGVDLTQQTLDSVDPTTSTVSYRLGDTWAPALAEHEPLAMVVTELADSIRRRRPPRTDGAAALRVLGVLEAASASLADHGIATVPDLQPVP